MESMEVMGQRQPGAGEIRNRAGLPFGFMVHLWTGISVFFCYAQILTDLIAPLIGTAPFEVNIHVQGVLMWSFALLAVIWIYLDRKHHLSSLPLALGIAGLCVIVGTLYIFYDVRILISGYLLLVIASLLNPARLLTNLNREVRAQASELAALNRTLEDRVETQVGEIERLARLKRFLPKEVADLVAAKGEESLLNSHRRQIACLFCDIRNFTAFSDAVEPEEVMNLLQAVHESMGRLVAEHGGTIGYRAGDGVMVIFNDPLPLDQPVLQAVKLALEMKATFEKIKERWRRLGHKLGFSIGIAFGYATLGLIGAEGRYDYTAIGNVVNIASRLCDSAKDGQILIDQRGYIEGEKAVDAEAIGLLELKGVAKPVETHRVIGLTTPT